MSMTLSLDLENITLNDLISFIQSVEAAGLSPTDSLSLEKNQLVARVETPKVADGDTKESTIPPASTVKHHHHRPYREDPRIKDLGEIIEDFSRSNDFSTIAPLVDPRTLGEAALNSLIEALKYRRG